MYQVQGYIASVRNGKMIMMSMDAGGVLCYFNTLLKEILKEAKAISPSSVLRQLGGCFYTQCV
jgi:hypothetical protein